MAKAKGQLARTKKVKKVLTHYKIYGIIIIERNKRVRYLIMREKYEAMGNEMIRSLGFENKKVILFWKAFEEERWLACELHYNCFKKGLTK